MKKIVNINKRKTSILVLCFISTLVCAANDAGNSPKSDLRGVEPQTPLVLLYESQGRGEVELLNASRTPALLSTSINEIDLPQHQSPKVRVLQPILRIEPYRRTKVRLQLDLSDGEADLTVQHIKRIWFETIPPKLGKDSVAFNLRYDQPLIIHPKSLEWEASPWRRLKWCSSGTSLVARNDSPYVIRLATPIELKPIGKKINVFSSNLLLPYSQQTVSADGLDATNKTIEAVAVHPATAWGSPVPSSYVEEVSKNCPEKRLIEQLPPPAKSK